MWVGSTGGTSFRLERGSVVPCGQTWAGSVLSRDELDQPLRTRPQTKAIRHARRRVEGEEKMQGARRSCGWGALCGPNRPVSILVSVGSTARCVSPRRAAPWRISEKSHEQLCFRVPALCCATLPDSLSGH